MSDDLTTALRQRLALDTSAFHFEEVYLSAHAAGWANARLAPLHEKLLAVVEAAERAQQAHDLGCECLVCAALAELRSEVTK